MTKNFFFELLKKVTKRWLSVIQYFCMPITFLLLLNSPVIMANAFAQWQCRTGKYKSRQIQNQYFFFRKFNLRRDNLAFSLI